jgi:hypothetical protein
LTLRKIPARRLTGAADDRASFSVEIGPTRLTVAVTLCYAHRCSANDGFVRYDYTGDKIPEVVIPAKAGISSRYDGRMPQDPGFRRDDGILSI